MIGIADTVDLERESLHISDGSGRICLVETKTAEDEAPVMNPTPIWRYQLSNHLGSGMTEIERNRHVLENACFCDNESQNPSTSMMMRALSQVRRRHFRTDAVRVNQSVSRAYSDVPKPPYDVPKSAFCAAATGLGYDH